MAVGVLRFDDSRLCGAGWASFDGCPVERFNSIGDLDSSYVWVADLGFPEFNRAHLYKSSHIRRLDFFRLKPAALCGEVGVDATKKESLQYASRIYGRIARIVSSRWRVDAVDAPYSMPLALTAVDAPESVSPGLKIREEVEKAIGQSTQEYQLCRGPHPRGARFVHMYFPRIAYARHLLSRTLPDAKDGWAETSLSGGSKVIGVSKGKVIAGTLEWLEKIKGLSQDRAFFLKLRVLETAPNQSALHEFGRGANTKSRMWASLPEIISLARYCKLEVFGGFHCAASAREPGEVITGRTYSEGIAAEIFWVSRAMGASTNKFNPVGSYLRAYDRVLCGRAAELLAADGYSVASYGSGRVCVATPAVTSSLRKSALRAGLIPPAN